MNDANLLQFLGVCVVAAPATLLAVLGLSALFGRPVREIAVSHVTQTAVIVGLLACLGVLGVMLLTGERLVVVDVGDWVNLQDEHYHFRFKFVFDRLSVPFAILSFVLCGITGAFASKYLHRESGYGRFFVLYALFLLGMILTSLAGTIETLFAGWELVGLSSALLVGFFMNARRRSGTGCACGPCTACRTRRFCSPRSRCII